MQYMNLNGLLLSQYDKTALDSYMKKATATGHNSGNMIQSITSHNRGEGFEMSITEASGHGHNFESSLPKFRGLPIGE